MLVFVHVSSMKTKRLGSIPLWRFVHCARLRATSGRSRSLATTVFFKAELLGVDEVPDRSVVDLEATLGELSNEPPQGELCLLGPPQQPNTMLPCDRLGLVPAHLAWRSAARFPETPNPVDDCADAYAKLRRRLAPRYATLLNRCNHPFTKIQRIGSAHRVLASTPASTLNQNPTDLGIPNRFRLKSSRSRFCTQTSCRR